MNHLPVTSRTATLARGLDTANGTHGNPETGGGVPRRLGGLEHLQILRRGYDRVQYPLAVPKSVNDVIFRAVLA